ncbi:MAG TPA: YggS family pyridoxal phosphate-dependent enzyme [Usitatibacter sp.]|nr:YggS family pyridoxal phosphate-dependent enzyme [Usitatibacter sp.]
MSPIAANLQAVRRRIDDALAGARRPVTLVAVSKQKPVEAIRAAFEAGCRDFGENYVQEALPKVAALAGLGITWHYIGHLQTNKARDVAEHFDWVHGIDRAKAAAALAKARPEASAALNVCLQVNISAEDTKGGVAPAGALALAREVGAMPRLRLRGLMGMASPTGDASLQRSQFASLRETFEVLVGEGIALDTLSMGMSDDMESALAEGSNMVRVGTAIFGERQGKAAA